MSLEELNDQMTVLAAIQQRQSEVQKLQAAELDAMREALVVVREDLAATRAKTAELQKQLDIDRATRDERMREWDQRIEKLVSGFGAFLREHRIAP